LDWGVPVPAPDAEGKVLYVWFDAPIGYISATKEYFNNTPKPQHQSNTWEDYWKKEDTQLIHFIGKDNIVFHCIIFPAMLKAEGSYILPTNVPANEFMNLEGDKISTSRNWAVWLHEYLEAFKGQQDVLRYVLCANAPESKDNDFTWKDFQARNNNELVAILGNFINRALVLTQKYFDNKVPALGTLEAIDHATIVSINEFPNRIGQAIEHYKFREALQQLMDLARVGNKYLAETEPWKLYKENPARVGTILNISLQLAANLATLMEPFMPHSSDRLCAMLHITRIPWSQTGHTQLLSEGHLLGESSLLFSKIEDETIEIQIKKLEDTKKANELNNAEVKALKENISFDDFTRMDIRIATVMAAEKVAKTKKLLKLTLDTGIDQRTVVSGIAEHFTPEEVLGKQVCLLANLAPREIKGIESQGMILMAEDADGSLKFMHPSSMVKAGSIVG
jgi:methionyl-tRNA synthetase